MRAPAGALAALEVAVRGRRAALAGLEDVRVHPEAHGAAGEAPLEAGALEDLAQPFLLRRALHARRPRYHDRLHAVGDAPARDDLRGRAKVVQPRVRARPDEHLVDADVR